jgi:hypothetical protein
MSNYGCCYISTSITYINLSIAVSIWDHNKSCNKQQVVKTCSTNETCNLILVRNFLKVFLKMPKAFSRTKQPCLCFQLYNESTIVCCPSSLKWVIIQVMSG